MRRRGPRLVPRHVLHVRVLVKYHPQVLHLLAHPPPHDIRFLPDASGKDDRVHPVHLCRIGADVLPDPVRIDIERQIALLVALLGRPLDIAHIVRQLRQSQHAALVVQQLVHLRWQQVLHPHQVQHQRRVDIPAPRPHHQPLQRRKAHARVDRPAPFHRRHTRPVPQVAGDDLQLIVRPPQDLRRPL